MGTTELLRDWCLERSLQFHLTPSPTKSFDDSTKYKCKKNRKFQQPWNINETVTKVHLQTYGPSKEDR